jgi:arylsulfatase
VITEGVGVVLLCRRVERAAHLALATSWTLTASIKTDGAKTSGVIMSFGGVSSGMTLYLKEGASVFE